MTIEGTADKGTLREALTERRERLDYLRALYANNGSHEARAVHEAALLGMTAIDLALSSKDERAALTPDRADRWVEHDGFATRRLATPDRADLCRHCSNDAHTTEWHEAHYSIKATPDRADPERRAEGLDVGEVERVLRRFFQAVDASGRSRSWWRLRAEEVAAALTPPPAGKAVLGTTTANELGEGK